MTGKLSKAGFHLFSRGVPEKICPHDSLSVYFRIFFKKKIKEERKDRLIFQEKIERFKPMQPEGGRQKRAKKRGAGSQRP